MLISRYREMTDKERATSNFKHLKMIRSTGVYGHLPKFTNHKKSPWRHIPGYMDYDGWEEDQRRYDEWLANVKWPWEYIQLRDVGYLVLVTKKYDFRFWYMGNPYRHKLFEWGKRHL